jgi:hypothetical protein
MPYPKKKDRDSIDASPVGNCQTKSAEELIYAIMQLAIQFAISDHEKLQEAIGAIESAKQELYRKYISPAAAQKEFDNS